VKVDIWSDVVCPFCYIGKRRFERALESFPNRDAVEVVWHSFELNPNTPTNATGSVAAYLAESRGMPVSAVAQMMARTAEMGRHEGLEMRLSESQVANTRRAHEVLHVARAHGTQDVVADRLFRAYFTEGERIGDFETLIRLATEAGLDPAEVRTALDEGTHAQSVLDDERTAAELRISGVPFFVFNDTYAISGAQPLALFTQTLDKVWAEESA
jgi:predicted DsbA family dithiol-disulfide isomerase